MHELKSVPGSVAHTGIMPSSVAGLIPQMTGFLTHQCYFHTHIFVDDKSDFIFGHHVKSTDVSEAIDAKRACERETCNHGRKVNHYHADNGTFACKGYKDAIYSHKQTISYCGVGAHFQNGKAENRIKNICANDRTTLFNAMHKWHQVTAPSLWPFSA